MAEHPEKEAIRDSLSRHARETGSPALAHQSLGRAITPEEAALAEALSAVYAKGTHDFTAVAEALTRGKVVAPRSRRTEWTEALLAEELTAVNADLDAAYEANGYGA
jgi:hypothetical protein